MYEEVDNATDVELLGRCRKGDAGAWKALVGRYGSFVFSVSRSAGLSEADAADVTQQTFCILHESLDRLKGDTRLGGWLATVARRHSWRAVARLQRESPAAPEDLAEKVEASEPEGGGRGGWERMEWLQDGLGRLDTRCRKLLTELYLRAEPGAYEEVAERLKIAVGSIGPTRARCLEKLRSLMEPA